MTGAIRLEAMKICGFQEYCAAVRETFFAASFALLDGGEDTFESRFLTWRVGAFEMTRAMATSHVVGYRGPEHIASSEVDRFVLNVVLRGHVRHTQFGRTIDTPAGHLSLIDTRSPYRSEQLAATDALCVRLPGKPLREAMGEAEDFCSVAIDARAGFNAALLEFLVTTWRSKETLPALDRESFCADTIALLGRVYKRLQGGWRAPRFCGRTAAARPSPQPPYEKAMRFIEENLVDPGLSVASAADAAGISSGRLQAIARSKHVRIGRMILALRLEKCRQAMTDPRQHARSITAIAFDCGFSDAAHFSRAFKSKYGVSPRRFRKRECQARN